ncbi:hypothetical protein CANARDRAFT_7310 [[Candida] arabinofermentans NRRL YB-2248]|uniref:CHCH domain-containing protein n=1 Tax=[Candida] arabinofermentans NRRL YB-2248 TaxID=983967 RepID=A0A1E4T2H5_9ASCO|nr:hypothetical protein CANARDRAFT_7310 [[Candida] arabinofermentans NRRL YB-2248]
MSANPGNKLQAWNPKPPDRGSFPLDHFGDCKNQMTEYLKCLKLVKNENAPNCRILAKGYLDCRMSNDLMDRVSWKELGLPEDNESSSKSLVEDGKNLESK